MLTEKPETLCERGKEERAPQPERSVRLARWKPGNSEFTVYLTENRIAEDSRRGGFACPDGTPDPRTGLQCAATTHLDGRERVGRQMQFGCVLIHRRRRLGAAVADDAVEIQCGYRVLAQRA